MKLHEWFCDVSSSHTFLAHNVNEQSGLKQFGGTFWIGTGMATQCIAGSCTYPLGLGWWVVCMLTSCSGCKVHLIFGYQPCLNSLSCLCSVYAQHKWFFDSTHYSICPCTALFQDLALDIQGWHTQGDGILLFADFNSDIWHPEIISFLNSCGLSECVLSQHPTLLPPATFCHGTCFSHLPIDGVWASDNVIIQVVSILLVAISPGDHQAFLIDLNLNETIGQPWFWVAHPLARHLTCTLPLVEAK